MTWTPTSQFAPAAEPSVWERIEAEYRRPFSEVKAPDGYRFKMLPNGEPEFRVPVEPEVYLDDTKDPRLILEPIPAPKPKRYTITLEETGEVREIAAHEWWANSDGGPWQGPTASKYPVLRVVSREAK